MHKTWKAASINAWTPATMSRRDTIRVKHYARNTKQAYNTEAFFTAIQEMAKDPTTEKLIQLRDRAFEHAENEFEYGSILARIINQNDALNDDDNDDGSDLEDEDFEWADDQLMFNLVEEALELLKNCSELLNQMKHYRRHILLELDENDELPLALSGLHDTLLDRLEKLADVRNDF